jgi:hypothetical protein
MPLSIGPCADASSVTADIRTSRPGPRREAGSPTAQRLFLNVDDDLRFAECFRQLTHLTVQLLVPSTSARAAGDSTPRGCRWPVLAAKWPTTRSTSLPDEGEHRLHRVSPQQLRLLRGYVAYILRCRYAAWSWLSPQEPAAKLPPNRRPLWLPLYCGSPGGEPSLRSAAAKPPVEGTTPREFPLISDLCFLACPSAN